MEKKSNVLSIISLIFGIIGLLTTCIIIGIIPCIVGLIIGIIALSKKQNKVMSIIGIITSSIGIMIFAFILFMASASDTVSNNNNSSDIQETEINSMPAETTELETEPVEIVEEEIFIESTVIYDENDVVITVKGFNDDSTPSIDFFIENNSSLNLGINAHAYAINKIMANNNIYCMDYNIGAGKKANATLEIDKDFLIDSDIDIIETIDILFWFYDNDKSYKAFDTGVISLITSVNHNPIEISGGQQLYNENGIAVSYICTRPTDITYLVTNETGTYIDFDVENISVNDFTSSEIDFELCGVILFDGCGTYIKYHPSSQFLQDNDIGNMDNIEKVDFNLNIRVEEDYFKESLTSLITFEN